MEFFADISSSDVTICYFARLLYYMLYSSILMHVAQNKASVRQKKKNRTRHLEQKKRFY